MSGLNVTSHSALGYTSLDYASGPFVNGKLTQTESFKIQTSADIAFSVNTNEGWLQYTHSDGFESPLGRIQGVRAMDPYYGTWKSPDAYAGDVHDPLSQKPYMWNNNNPYVYSDPSGYVWQYIDPALAGTIKVLSKSDTFTKSFKEAAESKTTFTMKLVGANSSELKTIIPGHTDGSGASIVRLSGKDTIARDDITIGNNDKGNVQNAVAGEVFNAGRVATEPSTFIKDHGTPDPNWGNVGERKGAAGQAKIMKELK